MPAIRGITVSVGYADQLAVTLVRNLRHLTECWVITAPEDEATQVVARSVPGVRLHVTDAHRRHGARFNKGLCMEEGFEAMGRDGWMLVHDADVILPDALPFDRLRPDALHGCRRRILEDPARWRPDLNWNACPPVRDGGPIGFFQLFRADAPAIRDKRPWYEVSYPHAGGSDDFFLRHWPRKDHVILPVEVLHLGRNDVNWYGCDPDSRALMAKYVTENNWRRAIKNFAPDEVERAGELPARIEVPGYEPTGHLLGFEARARAARQR
jgi:hypothetical protein